MRKVIVQMSMSLDGYVASGRQHPGVAVDEDAELVAWKVNRLAKTSAHLMGRTTYLEMASFWPDSPGEYAPLMNDIPKIVFSKTLTEASWPTTRIARGELAAEIAAIKDEPGTDVIAHGGAGFAAALAAQGLVDEYCLAVQPVALGAGQGLFAELPAALRLDLVEAKSFECGVVVQVYRPTAQRR
ncbi:MAG TPA: dihydrofolate reductase family protein [Pseudonocardiaceae bacterium]